MLSLVAGEDLTRHDAFSMRIVASSISQKSVPYPATLHASIRSK
jgi:hypothetical protein